MVVVGGIFFSLFLDIDGQSLRLMGTAINWWLFFNRQLVSRVSDRDLASYKLKDGWDPSLALNFQTGSWMLKKE